jgi:hypothetical protein
MPPDRPPQPAPSPRSAGERRRELLQATISSAERFDQLSRAVATSRHLDALVDKLAEPPFSFPRSVVHDLAGRPLRAWLGAPVDEAKRELRVLDRQLGDGSGADDRRRWDRSIPTPSTTQAERRAWLAQGMGRGWADVVCVVGSGEPTIEGIAVTDQGSLAAVVAQSRADEPGHDAGRRGRPGVTRTASIVTSLDAEGDRRRPFELEIVLLAELMAGPLRGERDRNAAVRRLADHPGLAKGEPSKVLVDGAEHPADAYRIEGWLIVRSPVSPRSVLVVAAETPVETPVHLMRLVDPAALDPS